MRTGIKLVVFDLDGTLLRGKTVCELIAAPLGRGPRMRELELLTDWDEVRLARYEIMSWYADRTESELRSFLDTAIFAPGAQEGIDQLKRAGVDVVVASLTWRFAVDAVAERLGIEAVLGTEVDGKTWSISKHSWPLDKLDWLIDAAHARSLRLEQIGAVGDSAGDIPMLEGAGMSVYVGSTLPRSVSRHVWHRPAADIRVIASYFLTGARDPPELEDRRSATKDKSGSTQSA